VFDLGTLASLRTSARRMPLQRADGTTGSADISATTPAGASQFFAPGLFLRFGLGETPIVLGLGASVVPSGRRIREVADPARPGAELVSEEANVVRAMLFLAVDLTLLSF
jgi:hypothetical protein